MPNNKGGSGYKKRTRRDKNIIGEFNESDGHYYAKVVARLGTNVLDVKLHDDRPISIMIPGKYKKKVWVNPGDYICCNKSEMLWKVTSTTELIMAKMKFKQNNIDADDIFGAVQDVDTGDDKWEEIALGKNAKANKKLREAEDEERKKENDKANRKLQEAEEDVKSDYYESSDDDDDWRRVAFNKAKVDNM